MVKAGERLRSERQKKGLEISEIARKTKIKEEFLKSIENGEYGRLPSSSYAQGFVRNYANFLGLPEKEIVALFRREFDERREFGVLPKSMASSEFPLRRLRIGRTFVILVLIFLLLGSYIGYQYRHFFLDPSLEITSSSQNVSEDEATIEGKTEPTATLSVNGEVVPLESDGRFEKRVELFPGRNTFEIKSVNRYGRETSVDHVIEFRPGI